MRGQEQVKFVSSIGGNIGTGVLAAAAGRWFIGGFDALVLLWLIGATAILWSSWFVLALLPGEE